MFKSINAISGMNSMSLMHDFWTDSTILSYHPLLELSIAPAIVVQYCATFPALCGNITSNIMNDNKIDKNYNINNYNFDNTNNINNNLEK